jgi:hypothetical protein
MNLNKEALLNEAWRLRAWLSLPSIDGDLVGWRNDEILHPVAEWLDYEQRLARDWSVHLPAVWSDEIALSGCFLAAPPVLCHFIDLIDNAVCAPDTWAARSGRVTRDEALAALAEAERRATQLLLIAPVFRCAYPECEEPVGSQVLHGFFCATPSLDQKPTWGECWPFTGEPCDKHTEHVVVPPPSWWEESEKDAGPKVVVLV